MATVTVQAPVEGFSGTVAGVAFDKGVGRTSDPSAIAYFRRHGYTINGQTAPSVDEPQVGARDAGVVVVGTPLRDATVDPQPGDFLPPTNAGHADPHGPDVVSPELHGSEGTRPVLEGPVEGAAAQEAAETAHVVDQTGVTLEQPARSAPKADWVAYAVQEGAVLADAESTSKADLIAVYGSEA